LKNNQSGLAAVELALIAPIIFLILFGIINYGILLYDKAVLTNAAREGARWASINAVDTACSDNPSTTDPCGIARTYLQGNLITFGLISDVKTIVTFDGANPKCSTNDKSGCLYTVTVQYEFTGVGYLWASIIGNAHTLSATSKMYHE